MDPDFVQILRKLYSSLEAEPEKTGTGLVQEPLGSVNHCNLQLGGH